MDALPDEYRLGQQIKKYRKLRKLTQEQLAERVQTDRSNIGKYENGTRGEMGYKTLKKIAAALEIPVCILTSEDDELGQILDEISQLNEENRNVVRTAVGALLYRQAMVELP